MKTNREYYIANIANWKVIFSMNNKQPRTDGCVCVLCCVPVQMESEYYSWWKWRKCVCFTFPKTPQLTTGSHRLNAAHIQPSGWRFETKLRNERKLVNGKIQRGNAIRVRQIDETSSQRNAVLEIYDELLCLSKENCSNDCDSLCIRTYFKSGICSWFYSLKSSSSSSPVSSSSLTIDNLAWIWNRNVTLTVTSIEAKTSKTKKNKDWKKRWEKRRKF